MIRPNNLIDWVMQLNFNMVAKVGEIIAKEGNFDVIHAHDWLVAYAAKTLKHAYGTPIVSTIHATEAGRNSGIRDEQQKYINDTEWMLTYESSEVIVNSNYMKNELQRLFGLPFEKINVVPNGVDLHIYDGVEKDYDFRRQYAMDNEKIILFVGRLVYEKGIQNLIAAMPKILSNYHDAKLIIAGKGGMIDELRAQVDSLGLGNKVYFTGYLNSKQVKKMYKCADIAVFPSTYEPFGIVALEAMLSGNPVVTSDVGGLNEIVEHGVNGMKSYAGNANSIADSILTLLFDQKLCGEIVKNAQAKVKEQYNWQKIAQDTHFTYQKAICETVAERQAKQIAQEEAEKQKKQQGNQITDLLSFKKRQAFA
jgi:glycosyltransferase involved in cell wall biosynthesis